MDNVAVPSTPKTWIDREWDTFRCRNCHRVLFKFDDGQQRRISQMSKVRSLLATALAEGRLTDTERAEIESTFKHERVVEIKCTLTACKTMNYLMERVL